MKSLFLPVLLMVAVAAVEQSPGLNVNLGDCYIYNGT